MGRRCGANVDLQRPADPMNIAVDVRGFTSPSPLAIAPVKAQVLGLGCRTAVGLSAATTIAAVRGGLGGFRTHPYMVDKKGDPLIAAAIPVGPQTLSLGARLVMHAEAAASEAIEMARGHFPGGLPPVYLALALPEARPGMNEHLAHNVASLLCERLTAQTQIADAAAFPMGHAAGLLGLAWCSRALSEHPSCLCLLGGIDSYFDADCLDWLEDEQLLKSASNPWGLIPGE